MEEEREEKEDKRSKLKWIILLLFFLVFAVMLITSDFVNYAPGYEPTDPDNPKPKPDDPSRPSGKSWNVGFKKGSVQELYGKAYCSSALASNTSVSLGDIILSNRGDACIYEFTIRNTGSVDAILSDLAAQSPNETPCASNNSIMICNNLTYSLTTDPEGYYPVEMNEIIKKTNGSMKVYFTVRYTGDTEFEQDDVQSNGGFTLIFKQK